MVTAFVSAMAIGVNIMPAVVVAAKNNWRAYNYGASPAINVSDASSNGNHKCHA